MARPRLQTPGQMLKHLPNSNHNNKPSTSFSEHLHTLTLRKNFGKMVKTKDGIFRNPLNKQEV